MNHLQTPRYLIVIEQIKNRIREGKLVPGEQLPSEVDFAKELGVSRNTLREALRILEEENVVTRRHGIGTFVNQKPTFTGGLEELFSITDLIEREGKKPGTEILHTGHAAPHADDIEALKLENNERVFLVKRLRTANGVPLVYCIDKMPLAFVGEEYTLKQESLFSSLEDAGIIISYAKAEINTMSYHEEISKIMKCDRETPLLILRQIHYDTHHRPVLYSINFFNSKQISFNVLRKRML
ncbi:MAG TPA: GntR family transcriptional regulator [Bacillota bacterium]|nr:GntR family transcriptional regulator [Bacillota bacterium]